MVLTLLQVDPLIRSDLPVGRREPERSVHLEELIAIVDATASTHQVILSPGINDPFADISTVDDGGGCRGRATRDLLEFIPRIMHLRG